MDKKRLYYLDFIRVFSMFAMIVFHFNCMIKPHNVYAGDKAIIFCNYINGNLGQIGVSLFFIISGASLMYTYGKNIDLKQYYKKRWLGIFPMFYLAWALGMIFYFYRFYSLNPFMVERPRWTILLTLLGMDGYMADIVPNYYILGEWFLGCIICLYIIFPLLLKISKKIGITKLLLIYLVVYIFIVQFYKGGFQIDKFVFTRILDILFGMFIIEKVKTIKWYYAVPALAIVLIWLKCFININQMYKITIFGFALFIVLMYIGEKIGSIGSSVFKWFSKYSYAVFLVHHIVIDQICTHFDGRLYGMRETYVVLLICIIVTFICAVVLYKINGRVINKFKEFTKFG